MRRGRIRKAAFVALAEDLDELVYIWREHGEMAWMNRASSRVTGFTVDEFRFRNPDNPFIHPEDLPRVLTHMAAFAAGEARTSPPLINRFFDAWGRTLTISSVHHKILWDGAPAILVVSRLTEADSGEVHEADATYRRLVESARDGILKLSATGDVLFSNRRFQHMVARTPAQLKKLSLADLLVDDDRALARAHLGSVASGELGMVTWEARLVGREAEPRWVEVSLCSLDEPRRLDSLLAVVRDIHDARRLTDRLRSTQRLESLGLLAGGIAHDFNNILTGVLANASLAATLVDPMSAVGDCVHDIEVAAQRAALLCASLLAYVGQAPTTVEDVDLVQLVDDTLRIVAPLVPPDVAVHVVKGEQQLFTRADPGQLGQVLINLITNAVESLGKRPGQVTVEMGVITRAPSQPTDATFSSELKGGNYLFLRVRDNGAGMSAEVKARIFDPFFTTKARGRGLGLSAILGIVRAHGGTIDVESREGSGTTFEVLLPQSERAPLEQATRARPTIPSGAAHAASGVVLVVDDDEMIRRVSQLILEGAGYEVETAGEGASALAMVGSDPARFAAVIVDHSMPGMRGDEVIRRLHALRPSLPVVHASGYRDIGEQPTSARILTKPYNAAQLVEAVAQALEA